MDGFLLLAAECHYWCFTALCKWGLSCLLEQKAEMWGRERQALTLTWGTSQGRWLQWSEKMWFTFSLWDPWSLNRQTKVPSSLYQHEAWGLRAGGPQVLPTQGLYVQRRKPGVREMTQVDNQNSGVKFCIWFQKLNCISIWLGIPTFAAVDI